MTELKCASCGRNYELGKTGSVMTSTVALSKMAQVVGSGVEAIPVDAVYPEEEPKWTTLLRANTEASLAEIQSGLDKGQHRRWNCRACGHEQDYDLLCWFCGKCLARSGIAIEVKLKHSRFGTGHVGSEQRTVRVPRCSTCNTAHAWMDAGWLLSVPCLFISAALCKTVVMQLDTVQNPIGVVAVVLAWCGPLIAGGFFGSLVARLLHPGVVHVSRAIEHPQVKQAFAEGWTKQT